MGMINKFKNVLESDTLTKIGVKIYMKDGYCKLPERVNKIGEGVFVDNEDLKEINLNKIKTIERSAFKGCVNLGINCCTGDCKFEELEYIEENAFEKCTNLISISLPNIKRIGNNAFEGCENLEKIVIESSIEELGNDIFKDCNKLKEIIATEDSTYEKICDYLRDRERYSDISVFNRKGDMEMFFEM